MRSSTIKKNRNNEKGFTLVEMAIVMMIVGLAIASVAQLMSQRIEFLKKEQTREDVQETVTRALSNFVERNGRYPCPASLTAAPGDANYGREFPGDNCTDTATVRTLAADGIATATGANGVPAQRIRMGAVPFKELNIREEEAIDSYGNKIVYAVTEILTVQNTFDFNGGEIQVLDDTQAGDYTGANTGSQNFFHYIVYSTGETGFGGFTVGGAQAAPCPAPGTATEAENCDFANATFVAGDKGGLGNAQQFDDVITFANVTEPWRTTTNNPDDIETTMPGTTGMGPATRVDPDEELDIGGPARAQDNPDTPEEESEVQSEQLCIYGDPDECFASELIGGDSPEMECDRSSGEFIERIENGRVVCGSRIQLSCPDGFMLAGFNADGTLDCDEPPPPGCPTADVTICGTTETIPADADGARRWVGPAGLVGNERREEYICRNQSWQFNRVIEGLCSCDPVVLGTVTNLSCASSSSCGNRYGGTYDIEYRRECPSGNTTTTRTNSGCFCVESTNSWIGGCPSGFNRGHSRWESTHNCTTETCSPAVEITSTDPCRCEPRRDPKTGYCKYPLDKGTYQLERFWDCPGGPGSPGQWRAGNENGKYTEVPGNGQAENCRCEPKAPKPKSRHCSKDFPGHEGYITWTEEKTCPDPLSAPVTITSPEDTSGCYVPEPVICKWDFNDDAVNSLDSGMGTVHGQPCDCDTEKGINDQACSKKSGAKHLIGTCTCK